MTTDPDNPLNITDEDIGKEGRFLIDGEPAVIVAIARDKNGGAYSVATNQPDFYTGTFCCACEKHFPVGADGQFVWADSTEKVGT